MSLWRYEAMPAGGGAKVRGEVAADSAAGVRAQLRRAGLVALDLEPMKGGRATKGTADESASAWREVWTRHLRTRRRSKKAELFDGVATLLECGLPLREAIESLKASTTTGGATATRGLLLRLREALQDGDSLARAMRAEPAWFDGIEAALLEAGQHGGTLAAVLKTLADRHERADVLTGKLVSALSYPAIVTAVGLGVVVFLSTKTLPDLVAVLTDAGLEPPGLTLNVMACGEFLLRAGPWLLLGLPLLALAGLVVSRRLSGADRLAERLDRLRPALVRKMTSARIASGLAELLKAGVPLVEALRVLAPSIGGGGGGGGVRKTSLVEIAKEIEHGASVADAFSRDRTFDGEFLRLVDLGQKTGELPQLLARLGDRSRRSAERAVDRLAALLEPTAVLALAVLVGAVALAAVLPFFQLQEVLR
ncbi:MAG: type II secretion system F family protein [Planctomycetota bacterium JB042]